MDLIVLIAIAIGVTYWLRKSLETASRVPKWDKVLSKIWLGSLVYFGLSQIPFLGFLSNWYGEIIFLIYLVTVYFLKDYRPARMLMLALLPYGIVASIEHVLEFFTPVFYDSYSGFFSTADGFTSFWLFGFGIYALVQNNKERKLRIKQEEEAQLAETRKAKLEQLVTDRTTELTTEKEKLELTLSELKATQDQLIQSEKLASLGELTAGIAHEIQNPLNFVNNFAELSGELAIELKEEIDKLEISKEEKENIADLLGDLIHNQEKINHHGKRASGIVTGMLQHARTSTGNKEPTDLNALSDEFLRLAYHGLRAKDKGFNATMKTDFDETVGNVEVIPQDIGRVMLNLITNAFYEVTEKKKQAIASGQDFEPTVTLSTKRMGDMIMVTVRDNGRGIPKNALDKIFQPFFSTKPTGRGTGLGLSLAHDIVTKGHGGELKVETKEGEGTAFIVLLPVIDKNLNQV
jgi:two-component system NtrC family sensor kinase